MLVRAIQSYTEGITQPSGDHEMTLYLTQCTPRVGLEPTTLRRKFRLRRRYCGLLSGRTYPSTTVVPQIGATPLIPRQQVYAKRPCGACSRNRLHCARPWDAVPSSHASSNVARCGARGARMRRGRGRRCECGSAEGRHLEDDPGGHAGSGDRDRHRTRLPLVCESADLRLDARRTC